jgi:hypothetical protein
VLLAVVALTSVTCAGPPANADVEQEIAEVTAALKKTIGELNGSVTVQDVAKGVTDSADGVISQNQSTTSLNHSVSWKVANGKATADVSYANRVTTNSLLKYDQHSVKGSRREVTMGTGTVTDASVRLDVRDDGSYVVSFRASGVPGTWTMQEESTLECKEGAVSCNGSTTKNGDSAPQVGLGALGGDADGRVDTNKPNVFSGTAMSKIDFPDGGGTRTVTWSLTR